MPVRHSKASHTQSTQHPKSNPAHAPAKTPTTTAPKNTSWAPSTRGGTVSSGDSFAPATTQTTTPLKGTSGVPDGIEYMRTSQGVAVLSQREAGDFYCEHTAWVLTHEANQPGSSIVRDAANNPLVGFLHLPGQLDAPGPNRHAATTEVVGAAFRGNIDTVRAQAPGTDPVRVQLTGYGAFQGVDNNPTGDFAANPANVDAAMRAAYGDRLVGKGTDVETPAGKAREYEVAGNDGKTFKVQVLAKKLDVDDTAIDGGDKSVQHLMATFKPHAAISMGVDPGARVYEVVTRSDRGGLVEKNGKLAHDDNSMTWGVEGTSGVQVNDALGRAIQAGQRRQS